MKTNSVKRLALVLMSLTMTAFLLIACTPSTPASDEATEAPATEAPATEAPAATDTPSDDTASGDMTFSLTTLTGETIDDSIIVNSKLTMVNYWATWCGPCVSEIPDIQKLSQDYADKGFSVIGVLLGDEDYDGARTFLSDNGITYPVVLPEGVFLDMASGIYAIPTTMFFDSTGTQVGETQVGSMTYEDWASLIDSLLGQVS